MDVLGELGWARAALVGLIVGLPGLFIDWGQGGGEVGRWVIGG